jgi:hypothetical protein
MTRERPALSQIFICKELKRPSHPIQPILQPTIAQSKHFKTGPPPGN